MSTFTVLKLVQTKLTQLTSQQGARNDLEPFHGGVAVPETGPDRTGPDGTGQDGISWSKVHLFAQFYVKILSAFISLDGDFKC